MRILRQEIADRLLSRIRHPALYCALEHNCCCGDVLAAEVTVALGFPDAYPIGISHLGSQILYTQLNALDGVSCDRSYCPYPEVEQVMRAEQVPMFTWESRAALADFDIVGFSLPYEMILTNVLTMMDLAGIPLHSAQRTDADPIIVAGGAMADSPEVMADFIDIFLVGDGEEPLPQFVKLVGRMKPQGAGRQDILLEAARTIPAAYVPSLWQPTYNDDGTLASLQPTRDDLPKTVRRSCVALSDSPAMTRPLVSAAEGVFNRICIEVMRGCPHACRFCQAGSTNKPVRWRTAEEICQVAQAAVDNTGYREISLLSLSTGDHPQLDALLRQMNERFAPQHVSINVPSLRVDKQLANLPWQLNKVRKGGMTIAAEVGSDRMRRAIRKDVANEDLLAGVAAAYAAGWQSVKVYFMAGFPGETDQDLAGIADLCHEMSRVHREVNGQPGAVNAAVSWLVPKPHTPMQWAPRAETDHFWHVRQFLRDRTQRSAIRVKFHLIERSIIEAALARGDRRTGRAIENAWRDGARFDSWDEHFNFNVWQKAFAEAGLDLYFFSRRQRGLDEALPWDPIVCHRSRDSLAEEWRRYQDIVAPAE